MQRKKIILTAIAAIAAMIVLVAWHPWERHRNDLARYYEPESGSHEEAASDESVTETDAYVSPIDFDSLKAVNEDIYAWLEIPGTDISYPVLQHQTEDDYYLRRDYKGHHDIAGSLFTESSYNSTDMDDPMTIIYGHDMDDGTMFGSLQKIYSDETTFHENQKLIIYLPDKKLQYTVFAAVPFSKAHILYNYDFKRHRAAEAFYNAIFSTRELGGYIDRDAFKGADTRSLILSTCLKGNNQKRFLVIAQLDNASED